MPLYITFKSLPVSEHPVATFLPYSQISCQLMCVPTEADFGFGISLHKRMVDSVKDFKRASTYLIDIPSSLFVLTMCNSQKLL